MKLFGKMRWLGGVAMALTGCGGDGESSGVDTGLAETTVLRDITSSESITACQNIRSAIQEEFGVDQTLRKACELMGAAATDTTDACQGQATTCVTQANEGTNPFFRREQLDFAANLECDGDTSDFADCEVTVGEFESCMDARLAQVEELFSNFTCNAAATIDTTDAQMYISQLGNRETPSACQRLQSECPRAEPFGDEEDAEQ
jgi:hypothetical protein